ncbi:hypothetical protein AOLI_G00091200 [Acnodon oligacanthus]
MALSGNRPACPPTAAVMLYSKLRSIPMASGAGDAHPPLWDSTAGSGIHAALSNSKRSSSSALGLLLFFSPEALGATLADLEVVGTKRRGQSQRGSMELEVNRGEKEDGGIAGWRDGRRALGHLGVLIESALQWDEPGLRLGRSVDR